VSGEAIRFLKTAKRERRTLKPVEAKGALNLLLGRLLPDPTIDRHMIVA
jgi:hypothetical protein